MQLEQTLADASTFFREQWTEAVGPLHQLTWQTFALFVLIFFIVAAIASALLHYSWVLSKPVLRDARIEKDPHPYASHLRMNVSDHLRFHRVVTTPMSELAREVRAEDQTKYYVVSIVQRKPVRELVYREMRLQAPPSGQAYTKEGMIQLDARDLADIRRGNSHEGDNAAGADIEGLYDVYIRPVRWYDIRHWLMHPNREVRILLWVTLITTIGPTLIQVLFG